MGVGPSRMSGGPPSRRGATAIADRGLDSLQLSVEHFRSSLSRTSGAAEDLRRGGTPATRPRSGGLAATARPLTTPGVAELNATRSRLEAGSTLSPAGLPTPLPDSVRAMLSGRPQPTQPQVMLHKVRGPSRVHACVGGAMTVKVGEC